MDIEHWRKEIDDIDAELLRLLNMRARLALKVGALKQAAATPLLRSRARTLRAATTTEPQRRTTRRTRRGQGFFAGLSANRDEFRRLSAQ